jgi:hypothetical protein
VQQLLSSLSEHIDYIESEDITPEEIHQMLSEESLPHNQHQDFQHSTLKRHRESSQKIIKDVRGHLTTGLGSSFDELESPQKAEFFRNIMSFLARIGRVKMLCVFHSLGLDSGDIQDLCFKKGFIESVKEHLSKIMRLLIGTVYAFQFLANQDSSQTIVESLPDPGQSEIHQMLNN